MNKYTELSDFEINKKVAEALGIDVEETVVFKNGGEDIKNHSSDLALMKKISSNRKFWKIYDPCNNPVDAWKLILEAKLSIHPDFNNDCKSWIVRNIHIPMVNETNLARAISIAYLLMKDAENDQ